MATSFRVVPKNNTRDEYRFTLYKRVPKLEMKSIAYRVLQLAPGATGETSFHLNYGVCVVRKQGDDIYIPGLSLIARVGCSYELYPGPDGHDLIREVQGGIPDHITIKNNTKRPQPLGLMMDGGLMCMAEGVRGGELVKFRITPDYRMGLFRRLEQGHLISSDEPISAVDVRFPQGMTTARMTADVVQGEVVLREPEYSP